MCLVEGDAGLPIGRILLSVQLMSMLPWGQPEPPEATLVILNVGGAEVVSGTGLARDTAARARAVNVYFMVT